MAEVDPDEDGLGLDLSGNPDPIRDPTPRSSGAEAQFPLTSSPQEGIDHMTREELKAHLDANEARVEQMTNQVRERLRAIDEKLDTQLGQIQEVDEKMEEREEKFYSRIESTLSDFRAERQSDIGDLKEQIGVLSGEFEAARESNRASFRNNRILVGVAGAVLVIIQIALTLLLT